MTRQTVVGGGRQPAGKWETAISWSRADARGGQGQDFIVLKRRDRRWGMRYVPATGTLITVFCRNYRSI